MLRVGRRNLAMAALVLLGGCGGTPTPGSSAPTPAPQANGKPWVVVETGSATPSPSNAIYTGKPRAGLPSVSFLPTGSACGNVWPHDVGMVLIPMVVTPVAGGFKVEWSAEYGTTYRVTAVLQPVVVGAQPSPSWQTVNSGGACTASATITGLTTGEPYIVFLDAPDTPRNVEGTRSLQSGRSGVVRPL